MIQKTTLGITLSLLLAAPVAYAAPGQGDVDYCANAAVRVGATCVDQFEASVWTIPLTHPTGRSNAGLIKRIRKGKATLADLQASGATLALPSSCAEEGDDCRDVIFAVSLPGVVPTVGLSWWQAQQACANSGGRLPSNAEWQMAVAGTPDPDSDDLATTCNTAAPGPGDGLAPSGSRSDCVSTWGVHDMVGNAAEWVADWLIDAFMPSVQQGIIRGGDAHTGEVAGPNHLGTTPSICGGADDDQLTLDPQIGFRCVR